MIDSSVKLNNHLKAPEGPYSIVLPICKACIDTGCHIIVRSARQNAIAKQARLDAVVAREVRRQEEATDVAAIEGVDVAVVAGVVAGARVDDVANGLGVAEEDRHTALDAIASNLCRSRRKTRASSPRYV
jgi:hypothetical protein